MFQISMHATGGGCLHSRNRRHAVGDTRARSTTTAEYVMKIDSTCARVGAAGQHSKSINNTVVSVVPPVSR